MSRRGIDTSAGEAGHCSKCNRDMPTGPDVCLGWLDDVISACCGHGVYEPFVLFGDINQGYQGETLRGEEASAYFAETIGHKEDPNPTTPERQAEIDKWWMDTYGFIPETVGG